MRLRCDAIVTVVEQVSLLLFAIILPLPIEFFPPR
jgi:hypothetical protein